MIEIISITGVSLVLIAIVLWDKHKEEKEYKSIIDKCTKEVHRITEEYKRLQNKDLVLETKIREMLYELSDGLEWYANASLYDGDNPEIFLDKGQKAREILGVGKTKVEDVN